MYAEKGWNSTQVIQAPVNDKIQFCLLPIEDPHQWIDRKQNIINITQIQNTTRVICLMLSYNNNNNNNNNNICITKLMVP